MLTGKQFRLNVETLGIRAVPGQRGVAVPVPAGSVVTVDAGPTPIDGRTILVNWNGRQLIMFLEDVQVRGEAVGESEPGKSPSGEVALPRRLSASA
ncbi:MAG TPA: hypothetical protein VGP79_13815 [Bryobacteraceae bacterium]|jgi:hypothetical protein|nr:hypothetical protein [Bryobacteraceae bacterium]